MGYQLPTKNPIELKDNFSTVVSRYITYLCIDTGHNADEEIHGLPPRK